MLKSTELLIRLFGRKINLADTTTPRNVLQLRKALWELWSDIYESRRIARLLRDALVPAEAANLSTLLFGDGAVTLSESDVLKNFRAYVRHLYDTAGHPVQGAALAAELALAVDPAL